MVPGAAFEDVQGQNIRPYPPVDLRLFSYHQGCYYFIGDPRDFGYTGQAYSYYGAHPVLDVYGGGWCFMMGGHNHLWRPWSPYFTVVGPWYYWYGPYDPFFWSYWPYYSFYYRTYYPSYYAGGRYYRGGYRAAPPISRVPATAWRGTAPGMASGSSNFRGSPPAGVGPSSQGGWRGAAPGIGRFIRGSLPFHDPEHIARFHLPLALRRLRRRLARRRRPPPLIARAAPVSGAPAWELAPSKAAPSRREARRKPAGRRRRKDYPSRSNRSPPPRTSASVKRTVPSAVPWRIAGASTDPARCRRKVRSGANSMMYRIATAVPRTGWWG